MILSSLYTTLRKVLPGEFAPGFLCSHVVGSGCIFLNEEQSQTSVFSVDSDLRTPLFCLAVPADTLVLGCSCQSPPVSCVLAWCSDPEVVLLIVEAVSVAMVDACEATEYEAVHPNVNTLRSPLIESSYRIGSSIATRTFFVLNVPPVPADHRVVFVVNQRDATCSLHTVQRYNFHVAAPRKQWPALGRASGARASYHKSSHAARTPREMEHGEQHGR